MPYQIAAEADLAQAAALAFDDSLARRLDAEHLHFASAGQNGAEIPAGRRLAVFVPGYAYADRSDRSNDRAATERRRTDGGRRILGDAGPVARSGVLLFDAGSTLNNERQDQRQRLPVRRLRPLASTTASSISCSTACKRLHREATGVIETPSGSSQGSSTVGGLKGGYPSDVPGVRIGPIARLTYAHVGVGSTPNWATSCWPSPSAAQTWRA